MPETAAGRALPVGAILASALMAANYPGDSGEDVDRLIDELEKRGYRITGDADDDEILAAVAEARALGRAEALAAVRAAVVAVLTEGLDPDDAVLAAIDNLETPDPELDAYAAGFNPARHADQEEL